MTPNIRSTEPSDVPQEVVSDGFPSPSVLFDALSHSRRRFVLWHLTTTGGPAFRDELAARLVEWEGTDEDPERVETSLAVRHLPKLVDAMLIEYESTTGFLTDTPAAARAREHLELTVQDDRPRNR